MKPLSHFHDSHVHVVFTDIDGTLTDHGRLPNTSYASLWQLSEAGFKVIPVTGRPAGWCELIARLWPVHGVIGENGAFYFRYDGGKMRRTFLRSQAERKTDRAKLKAIRQEVLRSVPGAAIASDQFSRLFDLAIDFSEDVASLPKSSVEKIVAIFRAHGAHAKVSDIHVNGWFGDYDKVSTAKVYAKRELGLSLDKMKRECAFVGDSPNDEPMFEFLPHSFAVANIRKFVDDLKFPPAFVAASPEASGFFEIAEHLLSLSSRS